MISLLLFATTFIACCSAILMVWSLAGQKTRNVSAMRLQRVTQRVTSSKNVDDPDQTLHGSISSASAWIHSKTSLFRGEKLRTRLARSGYSGPFALDVYTVGRAATLPLTLLLTCFIPSHRLLWFLLLSGLLNASAELLLLQLIKRRNKRIRRSLPDVIDLLVICVDAGLGLDQAVLRVAEELHLSHPDIHAEFVQVGDEQRAGKPRMDAWQDMAKRLQLPEVDAFVAMIVQADRFGTPIARALGAFANVTRLQRTQAAEEQAAKATIKIIFPLVLFIFPTIFIVLLGPAALSIMHAFAGGLSSSIPK